MYRSPDGGHQIGLADSEAPDDGEPLFEPLLRDGELVREFDLDAASERALDDAEHVGFGAE